MLSALAALAVTIGLLFLTLHFLRRLHGGAGRRGRGLPLEVLQRVTTGPKQGVALLRVGERVLVVSLAEQGAQLLTELAGDDLRAALADAPAEAPQPARAARSTPTLPAALQRLPLFARLSTLALIALVALAPVRAEAQTGTSAPAAQIDSTRLAQLRAAQQAARAQNPATAPVPAQQLPPQGAAAPRPPVTQQVGPSPIARPTVTPPAPPKIDFRIGEGANEVRLSGTVGLVVFLGAMTLLPAVVLLMTSFTRILIVLHFLKTALGTQSTPPAQLLTAIAVLLTGVVMNPVLQRTNDQALKPYFDGRLTQVEAYKTGIQPFRDFMIANTRDQDLASFAELSGNADAESLDDLPTTTVVSAFVTSELRTAFQMGFVIFLPFVIIDLIVSSVLMSLGMFMLPPAMVSLPFKLLLFVLADGWTLVVRSLVTSFRV